MRRRRCCINTCGATPFASAWSRSSGRAWPFRPLTGTSRTQQRLDRAALVHRAITLRNLLERQSQVEDLAWIDLPIQHQVDELGQVAAHGSRAAMEVHVLEEELLTIELHPVRDADVAHVAA